MHADTEKALDHARKPEHGRIDGGHHECESSRDAGIGAAELWQKLDTIAM